MKTLILITIVLGLAFPASSFARSSHSGSAGWRHAHVCLMQPPHPAPHYLGPAVCA